MHPRNPYHNPPDFHSLAESYPPLATYLKGRTIDFHDDAAQRCLTQALLKRDFGLEMQLPPDRLCPPVPNRLNYVLWIQDIVSAHEDAFRTIAAGRKNKVIVQGLDVGTGASAIYSLLACVLNPEWTLIATEIDDNSYHHALTNIENNNLASQIYLIKVDEAPDTKSTLPEKPQRPVIFNFDHIFNSNKPKEHQQRNTGVDHHIGEQDEPEDETQTERLELQFTMCNPPFYSSADDMLLSASGKEDSPSGACTGAPVEMITPGGEAAFVCAMVRESVASGSAKKGDWEDGGARLYQDEPEPVSKRRRIEPAHLPSSSFKAAQQKQYQIRSSTHDFQGTRRRTSRWYTSMLGKLSSVLDVIAVMKELGVKNYALTEFVQGQTRRWAIGWSLGPWRLSDEISRIPNPNTTFAKIMPPRNTLIFTLPQMQMNTFTTTPTLTSWIQKLEDVLRDIEGLSLYAPLAASQDESVDAHNVTHERELGNSKRLFISTARETWSRRARRKGKAKRPSGSLTAQTEDTAENGVKTEPALICCASVSVFGENDAAELRLRWVFGWERGLFESFAGHVAGRVLKG